MGKGKGLWDQVAAVEARSAELARALSKLQSDTGFPAANLAAISSTKRTGLGEVAAWVREWTDFRVTKPDGGSLS